MKTITFECETITPMFLSGADGKTPELRPPSIKGALRFWWRAMNGHLSLSDLKKKESEIFGGTNPATRSNVIIRIENHRETQKNLNVKENKPVPHKNYQIKSFETIKSTKNVQSNGRQISAIKYIGYGLYDFNDNSKNKRFIEGKCDLIINYNPIFETEIKNCLSALNLFGCLGSKARNGFGSISLKKLIGSFDLLNIEEFKNEITNTQIREYPTLQKDFNIFKISEIKNTAIEALEEIAEKYLNAKNKVKTTLNDNKYIASDKIKDEGKNLNFERYPKRYFFFVRKDTEGKYIANAIYMPVKIQINSENQKYIKQNDTFQNEIKK